MPTLSVCINGALASNALFQLGISIYQKCVQKLAIYLTYELHNITDYNAIFQQIYELHLTMTRQTLVYQQLLIWRLWKILVIKRLPAVSRMRHCAGSSGVNLVRPEKSNG